MAQFVLPLDGAAGAAAPDLGGKAAPLARLAGAGFPVPPGLCLTSAAFALALAPYEARIAAIRRDYAPAAPARTATAASELAVLLAGLTMPEPVSAALRARLPALGGADEVVAVRSSATDEDGARVSFAGQYATLLGVRGEAAIMAAVLDCWRSFFHAQALAARAAAEGRPDGQAMAVLIQRMIDAECAGVCFTRDPAQPERDTLVIQAAWGLGAGVVDGTVGTDTFRVSRSALRQIEERRIEEKPGRIALDPAGGVRREAVAEERRRAACLPDAWVTRLAEFGMALEAQFGQPQDLEWAIADGQVWLLQSRPITTLPTALAHSPPFPVMWEGDADRRFLWSLHEPTPESLLTPLEAEVWLFLGAQAQQDAALHNGSDRVPRGRLINGRRYGTMAPSGLGPGDVRVRRQAQVDLARRLRAEGKTMWDHVAPEVVSAVSRLHAFSAASADGPQLAEHLEDALAVFRRHWMLHWSSWADDPEGSPVQRAFKAMTGLQGQEADRALALLLEGEETILTRLIDDLYTLAQLALATPALAALVEARPADVWAAIAGLAEAGPFREHMAAFLERYGEHMGMGFGSSSKLRRATWREDPAQVLALAAPYMRPGMVAPGAARARARAEREARVAAHCAAATDLAAVAEFRRWLPVARREATALEEHNYWIDQATYGELRAALTNAARWLLAQGLLAAADDLYWLRLDEIMAAQRGAVPASLSRLVEERRTQAEAWQALTPPPVLGLPRARLDPRPALQDDLTAQASRDPAVVSGVGASVGQGEGRARIVAMETAIPDVELGDVLVAENAGPAWTPVFPLLAGLVLDEGAFLQHAATTAREYGVPCVIRTGDATRRIADGAQVVVDGSAGTVRLANDASQRAVVTAGTGGSRLG